MISLNSPLLVLAYFQFFDSSLIQYHLDDFLVYLQKQIYIPWFFINKDLLINWYCILSFVIDIYSLILRRGTTLWVLIFFCYIVLLLYTGINCFSLRNVFSLSDYWVKYIWHIIDIKEFIRRNITIMTKFNRFICIDKLF